MHLHDLSALADISHLDTPQHPVAGSRGGTGRLECAVAEPWKACASIDPNRTENEGLWDWNLVSNRVHFSPRSIALVGCDAHEIGGTQEAWLQRVHPEDLSLVTRTIETHLADGSSDFDVPHRMLHADGSYRWMSCRAVVERKTPKARATRVTGSHADVTAATVTDPQTGLPNRLLLVERLTRSIERATRYPGFRYALSCAWTSTAQRLDRRSETPSWRPRHGASKPACAFGTYRRCCAVRDLVARLEGDQFAILLDGLKELDHAVTSSPNASLRKSLDRLEGRS